MSAHNTLQELHNGPFEVNDPGTGAAIIVDRWSQFIPLTIAASASETNTLADPTRAGQRLTLFAKSVGSGGSRVVTAASAIDVAGTTTMTFDAVDDRAILESVTVGDGDYEWRVVDQDGLSQAGETINSDMTIAASKTLAVTTADKLTVGGVIVPQFEQLSFAIQPLATITEYDLWVAPAAFQVTKIDVVPSTLQGGALTATIVKATGTATPVKTTTPMHTADAINLNTGAYTVQSPTLTVTTADLQLAAGERIAVDLSGAASVAHWNVSITLKRI
jgi:hypothetical protein